MTSEELDRARELFAQAIEMPEAEVPQFVERARQHESPAVVERFTQMLVDYQAAEAAGFLSSPAEPSKLSMPAEPRNTRESRETVSESMAAPSDTIDFQTGASFTPRPKGSTQPAPLLANDYEIMEELGRGGMGTVYRAFQRSLNRHLAIKIIPTQFFRTPQDEARFYLEAEAAARLDHPAIVPVQDVGQHSGVHYYTMSLVSGGSLDRFVGDAERLTRTRAAELIEGIARAVQYAHDRAVIHRDIKPANILLDTEGQPRLTDFGLAKFTNTTDHLTMTGQVMGTPSYMAPEQAEGDGEAISTRTDVYSLGATLYSLLAGKPPFAGETLFSTLKQVQKSQPPPLPSSVPLDLRTICHKCLEKSPQARYASANDLADDLRRFLDGFPIAARRVSHVQRLVGWSRRNPMDAALLGFVAATLVGATAFSTVQYMEAERNLAIAQSEAKKLEAAIDDTLVFASEDLLVDAPGMDQARRTLLESASRYFEQQLADGQLPPEKVADITARLGKTQFSLGELDAAEASYQRAIRLYDQTLADIPNSNQHWQLVRQLAQVHREYANLGQRQLGLAREETPVDEAKVAGGLTIFSEHAARCEALRSEAALGEPKNLETQRLLANAKTNLGIALTEQFAVEHDANALEQASDLLLEAQAIREEIATKHPEPAKVALDRALGCEARAQFYLQQVTGESPEEDDAFNKQALRERLDSVKQLATLPAASLDRRALSLAATSWQACGDSYYRIGRPDEALRSFRQSRDFRRQMLAAHPGVTEYRLSLAHAHFDLSQVLMTTGEAAQSGPEFYACQQVLVDGMIARPDDSAPIELLIEFTDHSARELVRTKLVEQAFQQINDANRLLQELPPSQSKLPAVTKALTELNNLAAELEELIDDKEA